MKIIRFSQKGLVGYWRFDEETGSAAKDSSPYGNHGTIYGATWTDGKFGKALSFDGVDDYVDCGNDESLDITDEITIAVWVKPFSVSISNAGIVAKPWNDQYGLVLNQDRFQFAYYLADGSGGTLNSITTATTDKWYHVAVTITSEHLATLYINGAYDNSKNLGQNLKSHPAAVNIGWDGESGARYFNGLIDEVRIYNRALSAEEIRIHYAFFKYIKPHPTIMRRKL